MNLKYQHKISCTSLSSWNS